ncbi:MAG: hypothetical protein JWO70_2491 [Betaproteobacteria bacterium]|jgi:hypothetical protein|nr:hypothetical protein [Betaproteobacteria bacterium]
MSNGSRNSTPVKPPRIDRKRFEQAFNRDNRYHDRFPQTVYLDRVTGDVIWVYENDEEAEAEGVRAGLNDEHRAQVQAEPGRYLTIPGLTHDQHHQILRDFLESDWTEDEHEKELAKKVYARSISGWLSTVENEHAFRSYFEYKAATMKAMAQQWLRDNGIK